MSDPEPGTLLRVERDGAVAHLVLDRPAKLNALTLAMVARLDALCGELEGRPRGARGGAALDVEPRVLRGCRRPRVVDARRRGHVAALDRRRPPGVRPIRALPMPTIAAIDGMAFGGGLELALCCDLRIAATTARFALPEVKIGIVPGWGGPARLAALVGTSRAKQMALTGTPIDAATALQWGLANEVVASESLLARASALAADIAAGPHRRAGDQATGGRRCKRRAAGDPRRPRRRFISGTDDLAEGVAAFRDKRPPRFNRH